MEFVVFALLVIAVIFVLEVVLPFIARLLKALATVTVWTIRVAVVGLPFLAAVLSLADPFLMFVGIPVIALYVMFFFSWCAVQDRGHRYNSSGEFIGFEKS